VDPRLYLVSYDVTSPKRWRKIHRTLRRRGAWQQLSAFVCRLPPSAFARLERDLIRLIDPKSDRLMIVDLGAGAEGEARLRRHGEVPPLPGARVRIF
jgi:CRISPR-associated protein Cas2